jgi:hypothetical protein
MRLDVLCSVTIEDDALLERDFEVLSLPGTLALDVLVNGVPAAGLRVQLHGPSGSRRNRCAGHVRAARCLRGHLEEAARTATVTWTAAGPLAARGAR